MVKNGTFVMTYIGKHAFFEKTWAYDTSNELSWKNRPCCEDFNTYLWGFWGDRLENVYFLCKLRYVTPEIDCLGKTSTILRVSTDIYGVSKEIDGKMFIFRVHLGMWPLELIVSEKKWHRWVNMNFSTQPRHVTPQIDCLAEMSTVLRISTHIFGVYKEIDGNMFIFRVNLGMWSLRSIVLEKWALFSGYEYTFMGFLRR